MPWSSVEAAPTCGRLEFFFLPGWVYDRRKGTTISKMGGNDFQGIEIELRI